LRHCRDRRLTKQHEPSAKDDAYNLTACSSGLSEHLELLRRLCPLHRCIIAKTMEPYEALEGSNPVVWKPVIATRRWQYLHRQGQGLSQARAPATMPGQAWALCKVPPGVANRVNN
jgi:hypothetical protein